MYIITASLVFDAACRWVLISVRLSAFFRFRLFSTKRLGIDKVSIAAVNDSAYLYTPSRGPWSVSFEVSIKFYGDT